MKSFMLNFLFIYLIGIFLMKYAILAIIFKHATISEQFDKEIDPALGIVIFDFFAIQCNKDISLISQWYFQWYCLPPMYIILLKLALSNSLINCSLSLHNETSSWQLSQFCICLKFWMIQYNRILFRYNNFSHSISILVNMSNTYPQPAWLGDVMYCILTAHSDFSLQNTQF